MKLIISILSLSLLSSSAFAYYQQENTGQRNYNSQNRQLNTGYQQQIDRTSPEGTEGVAGGPGRPQEGPDGTMYPSNNLQDDDPE